MATKKQAATKPTGKEKTTKAPVAQAKVAIKAAKPNSKKTEVKKAQPATAVTTKKTAEPIAAKASEPEKNVKDKGMKKTTTKAAIVAEPEVITPPKVAKKSKSAQPAPVAEAPKPAPKAVAPKKSTAATQTAKTEEVAVPAKAKAKTIKKEVVAEAPAPVKVEEKKNATKTKTAEKPAGKSKKEAAQPVKKVLSESSLDKRVLAAKAAANTLPRPTATPAARPIEKKPQVVIAHRKLENKARQHQQEDGVTAFQPEVYRSILDEPAPEPITIYRYSDEELQEFKELINSRLDAARKELAYLQGVITRKDEAGTEDTENRYMNVEDGSGAMEREQLAQLAGRQIQFVNHLEKALIRIENKTYGICRVTGKLIEKARLRAVPHATLSIEAKKMMSGRQN